MGRRALYMEPPRRPRIAKLAWEYFCKKHGVPDELFYDDADGCWMGTYPASSERAEGDSLVLNVPRQNIEGVTERRLVNE